MEEKSIEGLGRVLQSISLEDLYCGMALQGLLSDRNTIKDAVLNMIDTASKLSVEQDLAIRANLFGKALYKLRLGK